MAQIQEFLAFLAPVLGFTALATAAWLAQQSQRLKSLREEITDLERRSARLEKDRDECNARAESLQTEVDVLTKLVRREVEWEAVSMQIETHHHEAQKEWTFMRHVLADLRDMMRDLLVRRGSRQQGRPSQRDRDIP